MDMASRQWAPTEGWNEPLPPLDAPSTLVLVFADSDVTSVQPALDELRAVYPLSTLVGCSTAGHAIGHEIVSAGLVVSIVRFAEATITLASSALEPDGGSQALGRDLGERLVAGDPDLRLVFCLADGVEVDGDDLALGLSGIVPDGVVISGAMAGDGDQFMSTWVYDGDVARGHRAVAIGVSGPGIRVGCSEHGGWDAFGPDRLISRSEGSVVHALDDKPALTLYRNYLGALAVGLPATALLFPLAVRAADDDERDAVVRMVLSTSDAAKSMRFGGRVPAGGYARMMRADFEQLIDAAQVTAETATAHAEMPALAIAISCVGRRLVLGDRTSDELHAAREGLHADSELIGAYSYGQLAPWSRNGCRLHNQTFAITTIQEVL